MPNTSHDTTMRQAMARTDNAIIVGHLAKTKADQQRRYAIETRRYACQERDRIIVALRGIAYTRNGKFVPKRRELRAKMNELLADLNAWAVLARPEHPARAPFKDPAYPRRNKRLKGRDNLLDERNRLLKWADVLESRGEYEKMGNVLAGVYRLEIRLGLRRRKVEYDRDGAIVKRVVHYVFVGRQ